MFNTPINPSCFIGVGIAISQNKEKNKENETIQIVLLVFLTHIEYNTLFERGMIA